MENEIPYAKILRPTMEEFQDFVSYMEKQEKANQGCGIFKVIPPKKWKASKMDYDKEMDDLIVSSPIEQNVYGKGGIYELMMMQKKSMRVQDYRRKIESFDHLTDGKSVEAVEEMFWKNIGFSPPLYGADIRGSLFDDNIPWDLKNLPGLLSEGLKKKISGVNDPYLYFGSWKTMFAWHKEDMDLYSINYLHHGKPKFWYSLPREETPKFEAFARHQFPESFSKCKEYLRHKTLMISPYVLKAKVPDIKIHKMIHNPGEFIVTMAGAYHCGFNWGFNLAEAVNFAIPKWLEILPNAHPCTCIGDSVKIDRLEFVKNLTQTKKKGTGKKNSIDMEEESEEKQSSSTKTTRRMSDASLKPESGGGRMMLMPSAPRKLSDSRIPKDEIKIKPKAKEPIRSSARTNKKDILTHPILKKKRSYEPKHVKERKQEKERENEKEKEKRKGKRKGKRKRKKREKKI